MAKYPRGSNAWKRHIVQCHQDTTAIEFLYEAQSVLRLSADDVTDIVDRVYAGIARVHHEGYHDEGHVSGCIKELGTEIVNPAIPLPVQKPHNWNNTSRLEEYQLDVLAERDILMNLVIADDTNHVLVCKAQWAARANTHTGRSVVNMRALNTLLNLYVTPPALHRIVWSNLMKSVNVRDSTESLIKLICQIVQRNEQQDALDKNRTIADSLVLCSQFAAYHEDDIARAFQFIRFKKEMYSLLGVSTPKKQLTAVAGMLGIACLPAIYSCTVYPVMNNRRTTPIAEAQFFKEICTAVLIDRERGLHPFAGIEEPDFKVQSIRSRITAEDAAKSYIDESDAEETGGDDPMVQLNYISSDTDNPHDLEAITLWHWKNRGYVLGFRHEAHMDSIPPYVRLTWDKSMAHVLPLDPDFPDSWVEVVLTEIDRAAIVKLMYDSGAKGGINNGLYHPNSERTHVNHAVGINHTRRYVQNRRADFNVRIHPKHHSCGGFTGGIKDRHPVLADLHFAIIDAKSGKWYRSPRTTVYLFENIQNGQYDFAIGNHDLRRWGMGRACVEDNYLTFETDSDTIGADGKIYVSQWVRTSKN